MVQLFSYEDFQILQKSYVRTEASTAFLVEAIKDFKDAWVAFRQTDTMRSRDLLVAYHFSNPNAAGSKDKLNSASGPETYHAVHRKYHPEYRAILYQRNYYDIFFFDLQGNCIYSVFKELDFATNFAAAGTGPYRSSGLGEAYQAALASPEEIHVTRWAPYDPSKGALASFICTGVRDGSELIGVFCTQMPAETRPITVAEMESALDRSSKSMYLATSYKVYHPGCTSTISQTAWEQLIAKMSLLDVDSYRIETEFQLLNAGYSQLWLDQADQGREEQKASVAASVTTELGDALVEFKAAWDAYRSTNEERSLGSRLLSLQIRYILLNPHPTGQKDKLNFAEGPETYHEVHRKYHPTYRALLYEKNYYDIFFLDVEGNCIYSVYKELDYATNFAENGGGEWKESGLGDAFRAAMKSPHEVNYIDWKPYGPSNGALASFLSVGVHRGEKMVGVFCTQLPPEIEPRNSSAYLQDLIHDLSVTFQKFRYGSLEDSIYPAPTQPITSGLIAANDIWDQLKPVLQEEQNMAAVRLLTNQLAEAAASLNPLLLDGAWEAYPALEGAKIQTSALLLLKLQHLTRDAVRFALNGQSAPFQADIKAVDENLQALMNGRTGSGRRLVTKNDIDIVSSAEGTELLKLLETAWHAQKPKLVEFFDMTTASEAALKSLIDAADDTRTAAENVMQYVSTTTRTTTLIEVHVLTPVPLTGKWAAGQTFRTALRLAESLINQDQIILPGYELKHDIMDDECDGGKGADVVVSASTAKDTYVALAGMGCNDVCRQVSTLSASLKLPFLSFYCPNPDFSNVAVYPQLARLGTVLEPHLPQIMGELKVRHAWSHIFVISCDSSNSEEADRYVDMLQNVGIRPTSLTPASDKRFEDIQNLMKGIKEQSQGEQRVVLVVGDETFFRSLICASITARLEKGVTWISFGVQRAEWWKKSDLSTSAQRQWVAETAGSFQLAKAFTELKNGWDLFRQSTQATRSVLTELYVTELKDALITVDGTESYHEAHQEWHPIYRSLLYRRKYYDIFFFDLEGNMIYSVYKEADFATNFAASSNGPWKDSGLGRVYQEALAKPDDIHYADFAPYGPSGGADAAFFAKGVRDSTDQLIGVYAIQLPPDYQKSIEDRVPGCSLDAINAAYEGAVTVVGLGKPLSEDMEKPLPCFKGHSPRSFRTLLDHHLQNGFPEGDLSTIVSDPYDDVKGFAVDAACAFAFSLQSMLKQGYTMGQVQHADDEIYQRFTTFLRSSMDFQGISGRVKFDGNDRANSLVIQQVQQGRSVEVGLMDLLGLRWLGNGTVADSWKIEPVPPFEQMWLIQAALVSLAIVCPCLLGLVIGIRMVRQKRALQSASNVPNALV